MPKCLPPSGWPSDESNCPTCILQGPVTSDSQFVVQKHLRLEGTLELVGLNLLLWQKEKQRHRDSLQSAQKLPCPHQEPSWIKGSVLCLSTLF